MPKPYFIGGAADAAGVNPKTLRYYEAVGLLPLLERTQAGYRVYSTDAIRRLGFIVKAKRLGLTLREIREILSIRDGGDVPCVHLQTLLHRKVREVDRRIAELTSLRQELRRMARRFGRAIRMAGQAAVCPHVEALPPPPVRSRTSGRS